MAVEEGKAAPAFTLLDQDGNKVALKDFKGEKQVVLFFYPKDNTPGCTKEACSFRDNIKTIEKKDAVIIGISRDNAKSHLKFIEKFDLPFTLLCDEKEVACQKYDVIKEKNMYGKKVMGIERSTFIIGKDGKIKKIFRKVKVDGHTEQVLEALE
jgi:peroxiredoxin Q/BCP